MRAAIGLFCVLCAVFAAAQTAPLHVCLISGSFEYNSDTSLEVFKKYMESGYHVDCTLLKATDWNKLPGLEALDTCDVALFFTRRLTLRGNDLDRIKHYCNSGKPIVAVRTASHGFQHWLAFDKEVLGGNYQGHLDEGPTTGAHVATLLKNHPILEGVEPIRSRYSLYKTKPLAKDVAVLLYGKTPFANGPQPLAWTREHKGGRVFYTSLGGVGDFEGESFKRMLANALFWTARRPVDRLPLPDLSPRIQAEGHIQLALRSRTEVNGVWRDQTLVKALPVAETAILLCDMWDKHWCTFASDRVAAMAPRMNTVISAARQAGMQIIHAPSETLGFYGDTPPRRRVQAAPPVEPPVEKNIDEPSLPIDDSDGGCPDSEKSYGAWTRQHPAIVISDADIISDDGREIYSFLQQEGIKNLLFMGVHTNMCVLGRSFGIRQMTKWGVNCFLVRDLTDTMYNPAMPPQVTHDEGTEQVVQHIEKYWCPSLLSSDLMNAIARK